MKPDFALNLSPDGITLLRRAARGWAHVGEAGLDDPGLKRRLSRLRDEAQSSHEGVFATKLILPESQVLYTSIESPGRDRDARVAAIRKALDGLTPYALNELVFDWEADGELLHVAVVARETIDEAAAFAVEHQFNPVSVVARPKGGSFTGEPFFGETATAHDILNGGERVDRDMQPTAVAHRAAKPVARAPEPEPAAQARKTTPDNDVVEAAPGPAEAAPVDAPAETPAEVEDASAAGDTQFAPDEPETVTALDPDDISAEPAETRAVESEDPQPAAYGDAAETPPGADAGKGPPSGAPDATEVSKTVAAGGLPTPGTSGAPPVVGADRLAVTSGQLPPLEPEPPAAPVAAKPLHAPARAPRPAALPEPAAPTGFRKVLAQPRPIAGTRDRDDEAEDLSVFGARLPARPGRSPLTGIMLSAAVLALIAGAAIWLTVSRPSEPQPGAEIAAAVPAAPPEPEAAPQIAAMPAPVTAPDPLPGTAAPALSEPVADPVTSLLPEPDRESGPRPEIAALPADPAPTDAAPAPGGLAAPDPAPDLAPGPEAAPEAPGAIATAAASGAAASASPSDAELAVAYAATGIWTRAPTPPDPVGEGRLETPTPGAADPRLPEAIVASLVPIAPADSALNPVPVPPPPGTTFAFNESGLITATPEGALTPGGTIVYLGRPAVTPAGRSGTAAATDSSAAEPPAAAPEIPAIRPRPRPAEFADRSAAPVAAGDPVVAAVPGADTALDAAARAAAEAAAAVAAEATPAPGAFVDATELAVAATPVPPARPRGFADRAARTAAVVAPPPVVTDDAEAEADGEADTIAPAAVAAAPPSGPQIPTRASVANQATIDNAIRLNQVNLIGIYGSASDRRALVRLASGRYVKVQVGDRVDGGQVAAISDRELRLVKNGRNIVLRVGG